MSMGKVLINKRHMPCFGISKSSKWSFVFNLERDKYNEAGANSNNVKVNLIEKIIDPMFDSLDRTWISTQLTYRFDDDLRFHFSMAQIKVVLAVQMVFAGTSRDLAMDSGWS